MRRRCNLVCVFVLVLCIIEEDYLPVESSRKEECVISIQKKIWLWPLWFVVLLLVVRCYSYVVRIMISMWYNVCCCSWSYYSFCCVVRSVMCHCSYYLLRRLVCRFLRINCVPLMFVVVIIRIIVIFISRFCLFYYVCC